MVSGLEFVASLVDWLGWPAAVTVIVVVLRRPLVGILGQGVRRIRGRRPSPPASRCRSARPPLPSK